MAREIGTKSKSARNSNDINKLREVYNKKFLAMIRVARQFVDNHEDAQDIIQEVFLKIITNKKNYEPDNLKSYIYEMIKNNCLDYMRKRKQDKQPHFVDAQLDQLPDPIHPTPSGEIVYWEMMNSLSRILTPLQWNVFILRNLEGYTYGEIALKLKKTEKAIGRILSLAKRKIKKNFL